ncbi:MAG TPA: TraR/DksA C4-type zinc finger protein [Acidimicrobiales bacterium]
MDGPLDRPADPQPPVPPADARPSDTDTESIDDLPDAPEPADREPTERERELAALAAMQEALADVDRALERIDDGTYGACEACGQPIPDEVLEQAPAARLCAAHARPMSRP